MTPITPGRNGASALIVGKPVIVALVRIDGV